MTQYFPYIFSFLVLIVLILAVYLGFLFGEIKKQKRKRDQVQEELSERKRKRDEGIYESLRIIGLAVTQDQCEISEGCIRIYKLLSLLDDIERKEEYQVFTEFFEKLKDFAYLEERQKLASQEKFSQDKERFAAEDLYRERMVDSCKVLVEHMNTLKF